MKAIFKYIIMVMAFVAMTHSSCVLSSGKSEIPVVEVDAKASSWLQWTPSVFVYDIFSDSTHQNTMAVVIADAEQRQTQITIPQKIVEKEDLEQGDFLTLMHENRRSLLSKNEKPLVYLHYPDSR